MVWIAAPMTRPHPSLAESLAMLYAALTIAASFQELPHDAAAGPASPFTQRASTEPGATPLRPRPPGCTPRAHALAAHGEARAGRRACARALAGWRWLVADHARLRHAALRAARAARRGAKRFAVFYWRCRPHPPCAPPRAARVHARPRR
jgi:hypothetical protein